MTCKRPHLVVAGVVLGWRRARRGEVLRPRLRRRFGQIELGQGVLVRNVVDVDDAGRFEQTPIAERIAIGNDDPVTQIRDALARAAVRSGPTPTVGSTTGRRSCRRWRAWAP